MRPRLLQVTPPESHGAPARPPDPVLPLLLVVFALGIVITAVAFLGLQATRGDTVPARVHADTLSQLAGERAAGDAATGQLAAQAETLERADVLARRLIAALDSPPVSPGDLAALRREVTRQTQTIERVRVVRVPVPGPTLTAPPAAARPQPARQGPAPASPTPAPQRCALELLGTCIAR